MSSKTIEKRFDLIRTMVSIGIALILALLLIMLVSKNPLDALSKLAIGPLQTVGRLGNIVELMIPFMFTGVAVCIMQQGGQFSMIMEGAFFSGGIICAFLTTTGAFSLPPVIFPTVTLIACGIFGGLLAFIPALLKFKWDANEVVASIMLNYTVLYLSNYFLNFWLKDTTQGFLSSSYIAQDAKLPIIVPSTRIHVGLIIAILVVVFAYYFLYRSKWGFAIRMTGQNRHFARYSGITVGAVILYSQIIGGVISGIGGGVEILGMFRTVMWATLPGYGFDGIVIAMLANRNPLAVPLASLFLAYLRTGGDIMARSTDVPTEMVNAVQGVIILLIAAKLFLDGWKHRTIVKNSKKELALKEAAE